MKNRKKYRKVLNRLTGKVELLHRRVAETLLARPLLPGEVVHHIDGDSTNNSPENLLVLPSQRYHAHAEWVLRHERRGQYHLFPEMLRSLRDRPTGSLFEHVIT
ncbi:HNH endonuclease [Deinococcus petrolearius]|uniref:HNH endonuclease n=1 Tax=Deinococcus petrolearius TaxID=1751295 RepID=A0ABW1DMB9_9DEIO